MDPPIQLHRTSCPVSHDIKINKRCEEMHHCYLRVDNMMNFKMWDSASVVFKERGCLNYCTMLISMGHYFSDRLDCMV